MPRNLYSWLPLLLVVTGAPAATSVSQYGITWTFTEERPVGQFTGGDWWVVGPVTVIGISTDLHAPGFTPGPDDDGSMVNPRGTGQQGYDGSIASYRAELNAGRPNGRPVAPDNPLVLQPHSSLVSMVSWLYTSAEHKEPGSPGFNEGTKAPRPVTRSAAVLTVLPEPAPEGSFRPAYCGDDKTVRYNVKDIDYGKLANLAPVGQPPSPDQVARQLARPWIDHVNGWLGAMVHPSENMPEYGRDLAKVLALAAVLIQLDCARLPGQPQKDELVRRLVQHGLDFAGIADVGGGWPADGGHGCGRKFPILLAGALLGDQRLLGLAEWPTRFQDDEQTFYVDQAAIDITHSPRWAPDTRAADKEPYTAADLGLPEWGIRHAREPNRDNRGWRTPYRDINGAVIPGFALAASVMGLRQAWGHEPYFDYAARYMAEATRRGTLTGTNSPPTLVTAMWREYAERFGLRESGQPSSIVEPRQ